MYSVLLGTTNNHSNCKLIKNTDKTHGMQNIRFLIHNKLIILRDHFRRQKKINIFPSVQFYLIIIIRLIPYTDIALYLLCTSLSLYNNSASFQHIFFLTHYISSDNKQQYTNSNTQACFRLYGDKLAVISKHVNVSHSEPNMDAFWDLILFF